MKRLGIDLGGTKIEAILLSEDGSVISRKRLPTEAHKGLTFILKQLKVLVDQVSNGFNGKFTIGIGTPGSISKKTGLLKNSNTQCLNGTPLKKLIEECLQKKVILANDANCFALAEAVLGVGKKEKIVFGIILGTGCGGGLIINKKCFLGINSIAGEFGHHSIDKNGRICWCGKRGCLETYVSGSGIESIFFEENGYKKTAKEIFFSNSDSTLKVKKIFYEALGIGIANLCSIIDPDMIVLGGGISNEKSIYTEAIKKVEENFFSDNIETKIVKNSLGDSAGVYGAAILPDRI